MPLVDVDVPIDVSAVPDTVREFIREAEARIEAFRVAHGPAFHYGFVPSDFERAYAVLQGVVERDVAPGNTFLEWGSGFGAVTGLASMLEFEAFGIEIHDELVEAARELVRDYEISAEFAQGSFIPPGGEWIADDVGELSWLSTGSRDGYDELGLGPDDFDVIYAYPWPGEEEVIRNLFEAYASPGALLVTFNGIESTRVVRRVGGAGDPRDAGPGPRRG